MRTIGHYEFACYFITFWQDVIEHDDIKLDTMFKISIAVDICKVMELFVSLYHKILHYILCCIINRLRHECFCFVTRDWPTSIKVTFVSMVTWKVQTVWLTVGGRVSWRTLHLVIFKEKILMTKRGRMKNMQVHNKILLNLFSNAQPDKPLN